MKTMLLAIVLCTWCAWALPSDTCNPNTWVTNAEVNAIAAEGDTVYIGGLFNYVGPITGGGAPLNAVTGEVILPFPKINGIVYASCNDGNGGWFVAGSFKFVDGISRNNVAHIFANGSLDTSWNPNVNDTVYTISLSGTNIFIGGKFTTVGSISQYNISELDTKTGKVLVSKFSTDNRVYSIVVNGSTVYVCGDFTSFSGENRNGLAAFDATTGNVLAWKPNPNNTVKSICLNGSTIYLGGDFTTIDSITRNHIAAVDAITGKVIEWNPNCGGAVNAIAVKDGKVFIGGYFSYLGGLYRNSIGSVDMITGKVLEWQPEARSIVYSIAAIGSNVYVGGDLVFANNIVAFDALTGMTTSWNPKADFVVRSLTVSGATIFAGGAFQSIGGVTRNHIAALDAKTGKATNWNPSVPKSVNTIAVSGKTIFAGYGDGNNGGIAALNAATGIEVPLSGFSVGFVKSLAASGTVVYAGGYSAPYFSAIDVITGNVPFNIELNGGVQAVAANEKTIYIGAALGNNLIALDAFNHNPLPWNRNPNWWAVDALTLNGSTLYVASNLDTIGGQLRVELAALDADTRQVLPWRPSVNYHVYAIAANSTTVFVGGQSTNGVESRIYTTALDATSGNDLQWNPHITNGHINAIAATKTKVFLGGLFRTTGSGIIHDHFAQFDDNNPVSLNQPMSVPFSYKSSLKITNLSNKCFRKEAVAKIGYTLPISATVSMRLYNLQGHFESELVNKRQNAGEYSIVMQRGKLAAGTYLVEFKARDFREGKILTLTK